MAPRSSGKSPSAYRTIREVSDDVGVPQHVLRFWETKFSMVKPLKRSGNRRYYKPEDVEVLQTIRTLLHDEGYTIKGVQKRFKENGLRATVKVVMEGSFASSPVAEHTREAPAEPLDEAPKAVPSEAHSMAAEAGQDQEAAGDGEQASAAVISPTLAPAPRGLPSAAQERLGAVLTELKALRQQLAVENP